MANFLSLNLKVMLYDSDFYALQALNSYLAWDRRTRVTFHTDNFQALIHHLQRVAHAELPDVIVLDIDHFGGAEGVREVIKRLHQFAPRAHIVCLVQTLDEGIIEAAAEARARACLLKGDVRLQMTWAVCYAVAHDFLITTRIEPLARATRHHRLYNAHVLPPQRDYPEMTDRIRQAIQLCVIEGMPAHLAADEMGISLHTIRGYIKEGYRILETYDKGDYPVDMTPQERAFMRFTALADEKRVG